MQKVYKVVKFVSPGVYTSSSAYGNYSISYKHNLSVLALPNTLGIFCFSTYDEAKNYIFNYFVTGVHSPRKIFEVKAFGQPTYPRYIAKECFQLAFYRSNYAEYYIKPPLGTVCFPKIVPIRLF